MKQDQSAKPLQNLIWQHQAWPHFAASSPKVREALLNARRKQGEVLGKANAIGLRGAEELVQSAYIQEVLSTAEIEGETLNPAAVRSSVLRKLGVQIEGDTNPRSIKVDGLVDMVREAQEAYQESLNEARLWRWHASLFPGSGSSLRKIVVGQYRQHEDPMQIVSGKQGKEIVHYTAPPSSLVPQEMKQFLDWFEKTTPSKDVHSHAKDQLMVDGLERAAIAHLWFESIHPFEDGNGRIGRAIVDMAIAQDARSTIKLYSLSEQMMRHRSEYYDALNAAQQGDIDVSGWVIWFANACAQACMHSCAFMDEAVHKANYWSKYAHIELNTRQKKVIQKLLDAGDGQFLGGLNAEKYIKITGASKATATRDLSELLGCEMLFAIGQGKATRYYVNIPTWKHGVR